MDCFSIFPSPRKAVGCYSPRERRDATYCLSDLRYALGFIQEKDGSILDLEHQWQFDSCRTFYRAERILDTASPPAEQTHGWLKPLVDSRGALPPLARTNASQGTTQLSKNQHIRRGMMI